MVDIVKFVGIPFKDGGRSIKTGFDCWGLVMAMYKDFGITLPDFDISALNYERIDKLAKRVVDDVAWRVVASPGNSDIPLVILMKIHPVFITHAGVYIGHNRVVHTTKCTGSIISRVDALKTRIVGYYRYVEDNKHS